MATAPSLFKLTSGAVFTLAAFGTAAAVDPLGVEGQPPDEAWRTISTEHFCVTFPERLEMFGRKTADLSERLVTLVRARNERGLPQASVGAWPGPTGRGVR